MNQVLLQGEVSRKFDLRKVGANKIPTIGFIVATPKPQMAFVTCQAWEQMALDIADDLAEGTPVQITGSIKTGSYKKDGKTIYTTDVLVSELEVIEEPKQKKNKFGK
jgi:single-strand DNA-binding protein